MLTESQAISSRTSNSSSRRYLGHVILFFINPILALIVAIKNFELRSSKNIMWFFIIFYGLTMSIGNNDSARYSAEFIHMSTSQLSFSEFFESKSESTDSVDIVEPLIAFTLSRFTSNPHILFGVYGIIMGFFYSRNIWYLLSMIQNRISKEGIFLIAFFAIIIGFWGITGFRMWTAAHIFFYGAIRYLVEKKKTGLFYAFLSIFVHFSFIFAVAILFIYVMAGNRTKYYFAFFILTFFLSEINLGQTQSNLLNYAPQVFHRKIESYTNEEYAETLDSKREFERNWRYRFYPKAIKWSAFAFLIVAFLMARDKKLPIYLVGLLSFALLFAAMANIVSLMPSGARFLKVSYLFVFFLTFILIQNNYKTKLLSRIFYISVPLLLFYAAGDINSILHTFGFSIVSNPIVIVLYNSETSLMSLF